MRSPSQSSAAPWPRRVAQPLILLALAGCAPPPQLETPPVLQPGVTSSPRLLPLDDVLAVAPPGDPAEYAQEEAAFAARIAALRLRAARLRQQTAQD